MQFSTFFECNLAKFLEALPPSWGGGVQKLAHPPLPERNPGSGTGEGGGGKYFADFSFRPNES